MDKNSLHKLISDKLGVSSSKKEFAFEAFLKKISQSLETDEAIKIPGVGYFQLKNEPLIKEERTLSRGQKKLTKRTLYFSPEVSNDKDETSLFLSFDLDEPRKDFTEFDESVFSIGIQKPVAPIFEEDENYAEFQKSLESLIDEVIQNSEILNEFDLFENYVSHIEEESQAEESFIDKIDDVQINGIPEETYEEELETETINLPEPEIEGFEDELQKEEPANEHEEVEEEGNVEEQEIVNNKLGNDPFEKLDEIKFNDEEGPKEELEEHEDIEENVEEGVVENAGAENEEVNENETSKEKLEEIKKSTIPSFEEIFENDDDIIESVLPSSENDILNRQVEIEDEGEESIEWDWGDELKAEFQEEHEDETKSENELESEESNQKEEEEVNLTVELEDEIDKNEKDENNLTENDDIEEEPEKKTEEDNGEYPDMAFAKGISKTIDEEDIEEDEPEETKEEVIEEKKEKKKLSFKSYDWKSQNFGKGFWILLGAFALFNLIGVYYLLFWGGENQNIAETQVQQADTTITEAGIQGQEIAKVDTGEVIKSEPIEIAAVEKQPVEPKPLYRKIENETRINNRVYYDSRRYMIQVSSFKSKIRAENDATRYQAMGHDAFIVEAYLPQLGGTWYRVRIGYFSTEQEAKNFITKNNL